MKNYVRITSGEFRGRKIETPGDGTHPMGERERLALFNMIAERLPGAMVLDAFSGSGALGIEALSRGARGAVFVDASRKAVGCIRSNLSLLGLRISDDFKKHSLDVRGKSLADDERSSHVISEGGRDEGRGPSGDHPLRTMEVVCAKIQDFNPEQRFDIILADPPYDNYHLPEIEHLVSLLKSGGILVLSHPREAPALTELDLIKSRKYAGAMISVFNKHLPS